MCLKIWALSCLLGISQGGFGPPPNRQMLIEALYGKPCDCGGGQVAVPSSVYTQEVHCGTKVAYLEAPDSSTGGYSNQQWVCRNTPKVIPSIGGRPGHCPCTSIHPSMHSTCYTDVQTCSIDNKTYYTTILDRQKHSIAGGDWSLNPVVVGDSKLTQSSCQGQVGQPVCWNQVPPVDVSDRGGPQDQVQQVMLHERIEEIIKSSFPQIEYHPLALPKTGDLNIDAQTFDILEATFKLLNESQPYTAQDCWLCLLIGTPVPLALTTAKNSYHPNNTCTIIPPIRVQPIFTYADTCLHSPSTNDSGEIHLRHLTFAQCNSTSIMSDALCAGNSSVFVCGGNLAYTFLPSNWMGTCTLAILLSNVNVINGTEPVPIPNMDYIASRSRRAVQLIPLFVTLGISGALATGMAGLGISLTQYTKLSKQLIDDVQALSSTIQDIQDQIDSLAEVVLQNRRGLDLLTAERGGICLALQEQCCFYANKSGIVQDKVKKLQEDLEKRRKDLANNPLWSGMNGLLPYLLPFLGPLLGLIMLVSLGPILFNKVMAFLKQQLEAIKMQPLQVHYH
ncbi:syncytin-1-like [Dasypus novemcinctus]|uniref:syncytin-1-like n=1 Tax=Dasypus novemcinctus TaxID=9361 RepID=UPI0039C9F4C6